jgi:alkylation response protein AidB-like acyl-CoA dehydrogenase
MDHQFDDELVRETAQRLLRENHAFHLDRMSAAPDSEDGNRTWQAFADLGWLGLAFPESEGGVGVGTDEITALMEEFGCALVLEPYIGGVMPPGQAIMKLGDQNQRAGSIYGGTTEIQLTLIARGALGL